MAEALASDTSALALRPTTFTLLDLCSELYDPAAATTRSSGKGQVSAWKHWAAWCRVNNTSPWRLQRHITETDRTRESVLQAGFLRFTHLRQSVRPRAGRRAALPSSTIKTLAHIRKMHADRDYPMVASNLVQVQLRKLNFEFKDKYGVKDMIPKRKQPFTREILVNTILGTPDGYKLGNYTVKRASRKWRSVCGVTATLAQTGFRKKEITVDKHGQPCDADCLSRGHLSWLLQSRYFNSGSVPSDRLGAAGVGDFAILTPPPSKSDPFDMVWGDKPIWLPFSRDPLSAFAALAEIEAADELAGPPMSVALFTGDDGLPFSGAQLDGLLAHLLARHYPPATVKLYSWHSARIFLACALLAAKATRAQIQAVCRWQTEESLNIYACLGAQQYASLLTDAMAVRIDAARAATLADAVPFIDLEDAQRAAALPAARPDVFAGAAAGDAVPTDGHLERAAADLDAPPDPMDDADDD